MNKSSNFNTNKLVYISRVDARFTERDIIDIIHVSNIGRALYADITAVKDNSPDAGPDPALKFYSAFVMITNWNPAALDDFTRFGQLKVWVDSQRTSYMLLRPAAEGSEIPRTKVNIHQLAHYAAELYKRMDAVDKKIEDQTSMAEANHAQLSYLYDRVKAEEKKAEEQAKIIEDQNERMSHMLEQMEKFLTKNEELANTLASTQMMLSCMDAYLSAKSAAESAHPEVVVVVDNNDNK